jgi:N-ethylmaleimide reductase
MAYRPGWLVDLSHAILPIVMFMHGDFFVLQSGDVLTPVRENYQGVFIGNMGSSAEDVSKAIDNGNLDVVAFGGSSQANPD